MLRAYCGDPSGRVRAIVFDVDGAPHKTRIKGSGTRILIGGAEADPSKLKAGQMCTITYPDNGDAAIRVECQ